MLKIIKSGFTACGRERIKELIRALIEKKQRAYLIVPEQETVVAENEASREFPSDAPLYFEVTNFTRFANTAFRALGGVSGEYCDRGKRALIMWRTLAELSPTLNMTAGRREVTAGLVDRTLAALTEAQSLGVTPDELFESADAESVRDDARLVGKMTDLAKIAILYKTLLTEKYADAASDTEAMLGKLAENPEFLTGVGIFVEGFTSFTESQYRLIGELAARTDVTVHLTIPKSRAEAFEYEEVRGAEAKLKLAARRRRADVNVKFEDARLNTASEALSLISDRLFMASTDERVEVNGDELRIFEAATPFEECDFIASDIRRRVIEDGASYSDFAIVARSADKYSGILGTALANAEVPAFTSSSRDAREFEAIKLISTAFAAVNRGFLREDVITYAKCGLSGISRGACDEFEMYVNLWQINGRRFSDGLLWNMNPLGYSVRRPRDCDEKLKRINETREGVIAPLVKFKEELSGAKTVREYATALYAFLVDVKLEERLKERAKQLDSFGEREAAEENRRLWKLVCDSLDSIVEVLGDFETTGDSFPKQLEVVFSTSAISRIPESSDAVTVGSADMLRLYGKKYVYMIGVNDGEFPATVSDSSFFSEKDKERLGALGLAIRPELAEKSAREMFIFARSFTYATDGVTLSYSTSNTKFKHISRSAEIDRIISLTDGAVKPIKISEIATRGRLWSADSALLSLDRLNGCETDAVRIAIANSGRGDALAVSDGDITNDDLELGRSIVEEAFSKKLALTQTMIDRFVGCPLEYFCRFTVRLSPEDRAVFDARGIGSFIHAILENFFIALQNTDRSAGELTREEREAMATDAAKKYIEILGEEASEGEIGTQIKLKRLQRAVMPVIDGLCEEFSVSKFTPRFFELAISHKNGENPSPVSFKTDEGDEISIYGTIDRVDTYEHDGKVYLRVVDYKTGTKKFTPDDLAEGRNLQMFLYLKALVDTDKKDFCESIGLADGERAIPAGVIYLKTSVDDLKLATPDEEAEAKAMKSSQVRSGMVLDDDEIIGAMGPRYTPVGTENNEIDPKASALRYDSDGWQRLMETVESSVIKVAKGIKSGKLTANPSEIGTASSCEYCEYKPFCRKIKLK